MLKNKLSKLLIKLLIFVAILIVLLYPIQKILQLKNNYYHKVYLSYYADEMEKIEVGFFGGSHAYNAFSPQVIWKNNGIRAYNYSCSGQPIYLTYYAILEALKVQDLKVIVLDLFYMGLENEYFSQTGYIHNFVDNLQLSKEKIELIQTCIPKEEQIEYYFPIVKYHSRFSTLEDSDYNIAHNIDRAYLLGWQPMRETYGKQFEVIEETDNRGEIPQKSLEYLNKIIELAEEKDIKLIFTALPHDYKIVSKPDKWVKNEYEMYNAIEEISLEKNITFIRFNDLLEEIEFDPPKDMTNNGHVSITGAIKVSKYIGEWIENNMPELKQDKNAEENQNFNEYYEKIEEQYKINL